MAAGDGGVAGLALDFVTVEHPDGTLALAGLSLDVARGELLAVVGPSGSGKTTLLRAVAGLASLRSGRILIGGRDVTRVPVQQRNIGMVVEAAALLPFLDVAGNLGFGLRIRHVPEQEARGLVEGQARRMKLTRLLARRPATLSAGEQGRVGIARTLMQAPSVWLLDEPLGHLDPLERAALRHRIAAQVKASEVTTVYVTHDPAEALALGDRVAVLNDGQLLQVDTPRALYARPASLFVAGFVGSAEPSLLPARLVASGGVAGFAVGARTLPTWRPVPTALLDRVGAEVVLALRPEDVHDAAVAVDPRFPRWPGTVVATEFTGADLVVVVDVDAPAVVAPGVVWPRHGDRARLRARFRRTSAVRPGDHVTLAVDVTRAGVFDPVTGTALWHLGAG